jgi:hypothetical protein
LAGFSFRFRKNLGTFMGGYGSGRWRTHNRRQVVESSLYVSIDDLPAITHPAEHHWLPVRRHGGKIAGNLPCHSLLLDDGSLAIRFRIPIGDEILRQAIPIGNTPARAGGSRGCFCCPVAIQEGRCGRPCRKLYAPPGAETLGCRRCHRLAYAKSQRRVERLARSDKSADELADEADAICSRIERGESVKFDETLRIMRRMSYAISDIWESLHQSAESFSSETH